MALYEAVNRDKFKAAQDRELERIAAKGNGDVVPDKPSTPNPVNRLVDQPKKSIWPTRPSFFQVHDGKIEIFAPVGAGIIAILVVLVLLIAFYQIGKAGGRASATDPGKDRQDQAVVAKTAEVAKRMVQITTAPAVKPAIVQPVTTSQRSGDFVIVIKQLSDKKQLEPVKTFFDQRGIATEIKDLAGSYFLVTKDKFDTLKRGSEGYKVLEQIKQEGNKYKSPPGYGSFAPRMFSDAYGKKM
jgi:Na+-transporting methylmalonyl-CoA/oxaloacetate decarboxylase gamma subunit